MQKKQKTKKINLVYTYLSIISTIKLLEFTQNLSRNTIRPLLVSLNTNDNNLPDFHGGPPCSAAVSPIQVQGLSGA